MWLFQEQEADRWSGPNTSIASTMFSLGETAVKLGWLWSSRSPWLAVRDTDALPLAGNHGNISVPEGEKTCGSALSLVESDCVLRENACLSGVRVTGTCLSLDRSEGTDALGTSARSQQGTKSNAPSSR